MKIKDIEELQQKLDEYNIPMRDNLVLHISKDDASELLIDIVNSGYYGSSDDNDGYVAKQYIKAGIAYRMFDNATFAGMRIIADGNR